MTAPNSTPTHVNSSGPIGRRDRSLVIGFLAWTLFVWGIVRLRNILGDDALTGSSRTKALLLSATFWLPALVLAVAVGVAISKKSGFVSWVRSGLVALSVWSILVWIARAVDIALTSDRGAAFVIVHVVLGVISIVLAGLVIAEFRATPERRSPASG